MNLDGSTKVFCIFGSPVHHSLSPLFQTFLLQKAGLNGVYVPFEVKPESIGDAVIGLRSLGICGANITVPLKQEIVPFLDDISPEAKFIGAVNTVIRQEEKLLGDNTDGKGFVASLKYGRNIAIADKQIMVFGLGGAAKSIIYSLMAENAGIIYVASRSRDKARSFCDQMNQHFQSEQCRPVESYSSEFVSVLTLSDVLVNCSPLGLSDNDPVPFDTMLCKPSALIYDIIYNPWSTRLLEIAKTHNLAVMNGMNMLIGQGLLSFELWTGKKMDAYYDEVFYLMKNKLGVDPS